METLPPAYLQTREDSIKRLRAKQEREAARLAAQEKEAAQKEKELLAAAAAVHKDRTDLQKERMALKERTAAAFAKQGGLALQSRSANSSPLPSPGASNFGLSNGFFSSFVRSANASPAMSRTNSSQGFLSPHHAGLTRAAPTSAPNTNGGSNNNGSGNK